MLACSSFADNMEAMKNIDSIKNSDLKLKLNDTTNIEKNKKINVMCNIPLKDKIESVDENRTPLNEKTTIRRIKSKLRSDIDKENILGDVDSSVRTLRSSKRLKRVRIFWIYFKPTQIETNDIVARD